MKNCKWILILALTALLITGCAENPAQEVPAGEEQTTATNPQQPTATDPQETTLGIEPEVTFGEGDWQPVLPTAPDAETEDPWQGGIVLPDDDWED